MKRILYIFSILATIICITGCKNKHVEELKKDINKINEQCTFSLVMDGKLAGFTYGKLLGIGYDEKTNEVRMYLTLDDKIAKLTELTENEQLMLQAIKLSLSMADHRELVKEMITANASLLIQINEAQNEEIFKAKISTDDLKEIIDNTLTETDKTQLFLDIILAAGNWSDLKDIREDLMPDPDKAQLLLDNMIAFENNRTPYKLYPPLIMVEAYDDGNAMVYSCKCNDDRLDMYNQFDMYIQSSIRELYIENFSEHIMQTLVKTLVSLNKGLIIHITIDDSNEHIDIEFTAEELSEYVIS